MTIGQGKRILFTRDLFRLKQLENNSYSILSSLTPQILRLQSNTGYSVWIDFNDDLIYAFISECTEEDVDDWSRIPNVAVHCEYSCQVCKYLAKLRSSCAG